MELCNFLQSCVLIAPSDCLHQGILSLVAGFNNMDIAKRLFRYVQVILIIVMPHVQSVAVIILYLKIPLSI